MQLVAPVILVHMDHQAPQQAHLVPGLVALCLLLEGRSARSKVKVCS